MKKASTPKMTKPQIRHLLIVGAQKAGTTSLFDYLRLHPQIAVSAEKEVNFFTFRYSQGLSWYRDIFEPDADARYLLDASPQYLHHDEAPQRIGRDIPDAVLVSVLRDPIDRAISNFRYNISRGLQDPAESFGDVVRTERGEGIYLKKGQYARQLREFDKFLGAGRMRLVDFDDLKSAPKETTETLCHDLGLDPALLPQIFSQISNKTVNIGGGGAQVIYRAMSLKARFKKNYDALPRWVQVGMRRAKAAIATRAKVAESGFDLSSDTERFLIDYFADDVRALSYEFDFHPRWLQRYQTSGQAVPGEIA